MIYFSSDHHFLHHNVINFCQRPYQNVEDMHEDLIIKWNLKVGDDDLVYYLGDFAIDKKNKKKQKEYERTLHDIFTRLKGTKILVHGNHDDMYLDFYKNYFHDIHQYLELKIDKDFLVLFHYPIESWRGMYRGSIHLHGHSHGQTPSMLFKRYDVGVDCNNYEPKSLDEILSKIKLRDEQIKK